MQSFCKRANAVSQGPAQQSLAGRPLLFAFGSTLLGALVIRWAAIDTARESLQATVSSAHPSALVRAVTEIEEWVPTSQTATDRAPAEIGPGVRPQELQALASGEPGLRALAWVDVDAARTQFAGGASPPFLLDQVQVFAQQRRLGLVRIDLSAGKSTLAD